MCPWMEVMVVHFKHLQSPPLCVHFKEVLIQKISEQFKMVAVAVVLIVRTGDPCNTCTAEEIVHRLQGHRTRTKLLSLNIVAIY